MTAADVQLMQGLAQRVTATSPDLVNSDATFGEPAWNWGKGTPATAQAGRVGCGSPAGIRWRGAGPIFRTG
ncbi:hypothetical protein ACFXPY_41835 [Streptomyces sp. NPDC059153]|uniref:hypothetical protein n=1 Tax=Streptomyces sp. NPDC059153 TaxID=3346743 RepID=UPI003681BBC7